MMQKTLEAAMACVLQSAAYSCAIVVDEYGRLFNMGNFEDVCGMVNPICMCYKFPACLKKYKTY
jgi:hypothetical protein